MRKEQSLIDKVIKYFAIFFFIYLIYFFGFAFWKIKPLAEENKKIIEKYNGTANFVAFCNSFKYNKDCLKVAENSQKICYYLILC